MPGRARRDQRQSRRLAIAHLPAAPPGRRGRSARGRPAIGACPPECAVARPKRWPSNASPIPEACGKSPAVPAGQVVDLQRAIAGILIRPLPVAGNGGTRAPLKQYRLKVPERRRQIDALIRRCRPARTAVAVGLSARRRYSRAPASMCPEPAEARCKPPAHSPFGARSSASRWRPAQARGEGGRSGGVQFAPQGAEHADQGLHRWQLLAMRQEFDLRLLTLAFDHLDRRECSDFLLDSGLLHVSIPLVAIARVTAMHVRCLKCATVPFRSERR